MTVNPNLSFCHHIQSQIQLQSFILRQHQQHQQQRLSNTLSFLSPKSIPMKHVEEVALAYDKVVYKLRGDFAKLNFPNLKHRGSCIGVSGEL
ncbi:hypothetical protein RYX36_028565, partial [Vicia faba]